MKSTRSNEKRPTDRSQQPGEKEVKDETKTEERVSDLQTILRSYMLPSEMIGEEPVPYSSGAEDRLHVLARQIDTLYQNAPGTWSDDATVRSALQHEVVALLASFEMKNAAELADALERYALIHCGSPKT